MSQRPKYPRYQDYVIKDGRLVGEFDRMYQDFKDPWEQSTRERGRSEKLIAIHLLKQLGLRRVLELGCGLGYYSATLGQNGFEVLGLDISPTAIEGARNNWPTVRFEVGDILDFHVWAEFAPEAIVMAEITWYVLGKLGFFLDFLRNEFPNVYLCHLLTTYPPQIQKYGRDHFTDLKGILRYFKMNYLESGEIDSHEIPGEKRTYFVGRHEKIEMLPRTSGQSFYY